MKRDSQSGRNQCEESTSGDTRKAKETLEPTLWCDSSNLEKTGNATFVSEDSKMEEPHKIQHGLVPMKPLAELKQERKQKKNEGRERPQISQPSDADGRVGAASAGLIYYDLIWFYPAPNPALFVWANIISKERAPFGFLRCCLNGANKKRDTFDGFLLRNALESFLKPIIALHGTLDPGRHVEPIRSLIGD